MSYSPGTTSFGSFSLSGASISVADFTSYVNSNNIIGLFQQMLQGADQIIGSASADILYAFDGNDRLDGGLGNDILLGRAGDDTYVVDSVGDQVVERTNDGSDTVESAVSFALGENVENLTLTGSAAINGTGNALANVLVGNSAANTLDGGAGNDTLYDSAGADTLRGGADDDRFILTNAATQAGGTMSGGDGMDTIVFTGRPDQVGYNVQLGGAWATTTTTLTFAGGTLPEATDTVERITFTDSTITNPVKLYFGSLTTEMAKLSREAYNNGQAFEEDTTKFVGISDAIARGWRPVSAMELGMQPSNFTDTSKSADFYYEFVNGVFTVVTWGSQSAAEDGADPEGYAHGKVELLVGDIDGIDTLTLVFTGTDKSRDKKTYDFASNYKAFAPLIAALKDYITAVDIDQVLITGHSMGAALVQSALAEDFAGSAVTVEAFTFASPGSNITTAPAADITNFVKVGDPIPDIGSLKPANKVNGSVVTMSTGGTFWDAVYNPFDPFFDHSMDLYLSDVQTLVGLAQDPSNSGFHDDQLAVALRNGDLWINGNVRVNFGTPGNDNLAEASADNYILGGAGNDMIAINSVGSASRLVDGGSNAGDGVDKVVFEPLGDYTDTPIPNGVEVFFKGSDGKTVSVGKFYGIEQFFCRASPLFGGTVQTPAAKATALNASETALTFTLLPGYTAADAGDGAMTVIGTSADDVIYAGLGDKTIQGGGGNDLIIIKDEGTAGAADKITIDGGAGADMMLGGTGSETYIVDNVGDAIDDLGGIDEVLSSVSYVLPEGIENITLQGSAIGATGNALDNVLRGNAAANILDGGSGNDIIDGGAAADTMAGGSGNDTYAVDNAGDVVTESAGQGTDLVNASISYTLGANVENLTLTGSAAINGTGNALDNVITGNAAANVLDGAAGADTLAGGAGDDTYVVDNASDVVSENSGEGTDLSMLR